MPAVWRYRWFVGMLGCSSVVAVSWEGSGGAGERADVEERGGGGELRPLPVSRSEAVVGGGGGGADGGVRETRLSWRVFDTEDAVVSVEVPGERGVVVVDVSERERPGGGDVVVSGRVRGDSGGLAVLARRGDAVSGWITGGVRDFKLSGDAGGTVVVAVEDPAPVLPCGGGVEIAGRGKGEKKRAAGGEKGGGKSTVDLFVGYSDDARRVAGSASRIEADILGIVALSNARFAVSGVDMELRLVGTGEVDYAETGSASLDLRQLRDGGDGQLDELHLKRAETGADLVALLVSVSDYGGIAYLGGHPGDASLGFSVTYSQGLSHAFTHEIGHNCGCAHDPGNAGSAGIFTYSYGHRFTGDDGVLYRTQMAYSPGRRIEGFSNPGLKLAGVATGTATIDNARTINETREVLAAYRPTVIGETAVASLAAVEIVDRWSPVSDGEVQPGEKIELGMTIANGTAASLTGLDVSIACANPDVLISDSDARFPTVGAGQPSARAGAFRFTLNRSARPGTALLFEVTMEAVEGKWSDYFLLDVTESPVRLVFDRLTIDDDNSGSSRGDGDGVIEPGEEIEMTMGVRNIGTQEARFPKAEMVNPFDPYLVLQDASNSFYDIGSKSWGWSKTDYDFYIREDCPLGRRIVVPLSLTSREGAWSDELVLVVGSVVLSGVVTLDDDSVGGSLGNGDGVVQRGEVVELRLDLSSTGQTYASDVEVELVSDDPLVQITNAEESYGRLDAGTTTAAPQAFSFSVMGNGTPSQEVELRFEVRSLETSLSLPVSYVVDVVPPVPTPPEVVLRPAAGGEGVDVEVTLRGTLAGLVYAIERSVDLREWVEVEGGIAGTGGNLVRVVNEAGGGAGETVFLRVVQEKP